MENVNAINKIFGIRDKYNLTAEQFKAVLEYVVEIMPSLPANTNRCEFMLFEYVVRVFEKKETSEWLGAKLSRVFLESVLCPDQQQRHVKVIREECSQGDSTDGLMGFNIYAAIDNRLNTKPTPEFCAIETVNDMIKAELAKAKA
jgi:hypothetical protein